MSLMASFIGGKARCGGWRANFGSKADVTLSLIMMSALPRKQTLIGEPRMSALCH